MIFSKLSTDSQLAIFSHLPPADQLSTRLICRRFEALPPVTRHRKSLTLLIGLHSLETMAVLLANKVPYSANIESNLVYLKSSVLSISNDRFTYNFITQFLANFPKLSALTILLPQYTANPIPFDLILVLLSKLTTQLITFRLHSNLIFYSYTTIANNHAHYLCTLLNSCTALKHLTLHLGHTLGESFDLSILGQLKTFYFTSTCNPIKVILPSLKQINQKNNTHLHVIGIGNGLSGITFEELLQQLDPQVTRHLTHLATEGVGFTKSELSTLAQHCPNLTSLTLQLTDWTQLTEDLTTFSRLTHLRLNTKSDLPLAKPQVTFPAITHLHLGLTILDTDHSILYNLHLAILFPHLHYLTLSEPSCPLLKHHPTHGNSPDECYEQILQPLIQCTHLKLIVLRTAARKVSDVMKKWPFKIFYLSRNF